MREKISVHHVGGRFASRSFPIMEKFENCLINVLYDADEACVEQIKTIGRQLASELFVYPYCLGDENSKKNFNKTYDPYMSSLYELNREYSEFYSFNSLNDYIMSDIARVVESVEVDCFTLDSLCADGLVLVPDFLSLDTQGAEYDILTGSKNMLSSSILAAVVEVEFSALYEGQKLFGDISKFMDEQGFYFVGFEAEADHFSPVRGKIGLRNDGFLVSSDALFLKKINSINAGDSEYEEFLQFCKLSFISIIFNQLEYGLKCLDMISERGWRKYFQGQELSYMTFFQKVQKEADDYPDFLPEMFSQKYSYNENLNKFSKNGNTDPIILDKNVVDAIVKGFPLAGLEMAMVEYNLVAQAKNIKRKRIEQTIFTLISTGYINSGDPIDPQIIQSLVKQYISDHQVQ